MPKNIDQAAANLKQAADSGIIGPRYIAGIDAADWKSRASDPQTAQNYATGVTAAIADGRYQRGIERVTNEQWRAAAKQKGGSIIGQRVSGGIDNYRKNFGPILSAINSAVASLPARTTSPTQNVQNRLLPVIQAAMQASGKSFS